MEEKYNLYLDDNINTLKKLDENSIDSCVMDPPYGLKFMSKRWDYDVPTIEFWKELLRVLKPGAHVLSFGGTRTYHRMVVNCEDAGFEIRDSISWVYGSGFPKSLDIGKKLGDEYEGLGTGLKPAHELIVLARKPLSEKTICDNVLKWGTGGINIDKSRIGTEGGTLTINKGIERNKLDNIVQPLSDGLRKYEYKINEVDGLGRFPANFIHDGSDEVMEQFDKAGNSKSGKGTGLTPTPARSNMNASIEGINRLGYSDEGSAARFFYCSKASGKEKNEGLDDMEAKEKTGHNYSLNRKCKKCGHQEVSGSPCKCEDPEWETIERLKTKNNHPTCKPVKLMSYLINMITPLNGVVIDPFMGSGSTGVAAVKNGFKFIGIEKESEYMEIAKKRIEYTVEHHSNL
jgi:DNA modification methylase